MITVENLTKRYGKKTAVKDLTFTVPDGMVTGFLGPNGSGKSTSMRCILGLDALTEGHVQFTGTYKNGRLNGKGYSGPFASLEDKHSVAGAILDAAWFAPNRSARAHLRVLAAGAGISDERVDDCLHMVGLENVGKQKVGGFSLGMKQRLGLASALLGDPQHIIMDEPVNGLDPEGVSWMRKMVREFAAEGRSVLISSHLLSEMQLTADRLVVIGKGELIGEYSMDDFLADGTHIIVESPQSVLLADSLVKHGFNVKKRPPHTLSIDVPDGKKADVVRHTIAEIALQEKHLITQLFCEKVNLEDRFLAATSDVQEYQAIMQPGQPADGNTVKGRNHA